VEIDVQDIRNDFPVLARTWEGKPIVYFDNAATSLKPRCVTDAIASYLTEHSGNIHRANHLLSQEASESFERVRDQCARFLRCATESIVFVRGTTEAINIVAGGLELSPSCNVVGTLLEHHSNILPWSSRAQYRAAELDRAGLPDLEATAALIDDDTRLLAVTLCSNVSGARLAIADWVALAHRRGIPILVDAAQEASHAPLDVRSLGVDFLVLSGHKVLGPPGVGVLYGKPEWLRRLRVVSIGGGAVERVNRDFSYTLRDLPWRFESGTPDIAAVIGFGAALQYLETIGMAAVARRNEALSVYLYEAVRRLDRVERFLPPGAPGTELQRAPILSFRDATATFSVDFLSRVLNDSYGIMTRHGYHCAHPLHDRLGWNGTLRVSLQFYNTEQEVDRLVEALDDILSVTRPAARPSQVR
jgi:cysteine desulfurase/selenocysteine lyase